jgi:ribosomal protein L12E/L44/L45/RPP1/RPP2
MSEDWITKYGPRRVRRDPPTLDEAIFAAVGITDDQQQQAEIAAALMGLPFDDVLAEVKKQSRANARATTRVIAGEQGAQRGPTIRQRQAHRHVSRAGASESFLSQDIRPRTAR